MTNIDISFKAEKGSFNYRVGGVALQGDKVLLVTEDRFDFWYLPGGRVSMFETSEQALHREIIEELGETPTIERLLWTTECLYYFDAWNTHHHDLSFYYLIRFADKAPIYFLSSGVGKEEFSNETTDLHFRWFDINDLEKIDLRPAFLQRALKAIPIQPQHVIVDDLAQV